MKRIFAIAGALALTAFVSVPSLAGSWTDDIAGWRYRTDDGGWKANEWYAEDGKWYYFDDDGYMKTGWASIGGKWYLFAPSGVMMTGWHRNNGSWYFLDDDGVMASDRWVGYYYVDSSGAIVTDTQTADGFTVDSKGMWFRADGEPLFPDQVQALAAQEAAEQAAAQQAASQPPQQAASQQPAQTAAQQAALQAAQQAAAQQAARRQAASEAQKARSASPQEFRDVTGDTVIAAVRGDSTTYTFASLPQNVSDLRVLARDLPVSEYRNVAAMYLVSLVRFAENEQDGYEMIDWLRGSARPQSTFERSFLKERLSDKPYLPLAYFEGALPGNGYTPDKPYTVTLTKDEADAPAGYHYCHFFTKGADDERRIVLYEANGVNYLWDYTSTLVEVVPPAIGGTSAAAGPAQDAGAAATDGGAAGTDGGADGEKEADSLYPRGAMQVAEPMVTAAFSGASASYTFNRLPQNVSGLKELALEIPQTEFRNVAAMYLVSLLRYADSEQDGLEMIDWLRGSARPQTNFEKSFIKDRLSGKKYLPRAYFEGAVPENNYTPDKPLKVTLTTDAAPPPAGYHYCHFFTSGADAERRIVLFETNGLNYLWEYNSTFLQVKDPVWQ